MDSCDQILLVAAFACHSYTYEDLAEAFVITQQADCYLGFRDIVNDDAMWSVSSKFVEELDDDKTITQAISTAQNEWNEANPPELHVEYRILGAGNVKITPVRYGRADYP